MVHCSIILDDASGVFIAGNIIKGVIQLQLNEPKKFRGLYFLIYGRAKCHWTETRQRTTGSGENRRTSSETVHFNGKTVYLNTKTYLFGSPGGDSIQMPSGTHRYDFLCQLPPLIPGSFEASHGDIRYRVEAVLDVPWSFNKEFKLGFTVIRVDDLNNDPSLKVATFDEEVKKFCCLFCESEPLYIKVTLPRTGFAPGEEIPVTIDFKNKSNEEIRGGKIYVKRIILYHSETPHSKTKTQEDFVTEVYCPGVGKQSSNEFIKEIKLPQGMVFSNSAFCYVVQIFYELKVEIFTNDCHKNVKFRFPITIGAIPISTQPLNQTATFMPAQNPEPFFNAPNPSAPAFNTNGQQPYVPSASAPNEDLPPSFEEATKSEKTMNEQTPESKGVSSSYGWSA
ncbi:CLUMA_CG012197, isoform A [Clunio marinus]|uniref:CLUMA_CG012197, isoform A n=1 Tax=Clunio marinus TaxID=568069 RepID=A0A1J1IJH8_9DIPT|nr:CLUMA_CG012197, isoform A [Clunio marinus]